MEGNGGLADTGFPVGLSRIQEYVVFYWLNWPAPLFRYASHFVLVGGSLAPLAFLLCGFLGLTRLPVVIPAYYAQPIHTSGSM